MLKRLLGRDSENTNKECAESGLEQPYLIEKNQIFDRPVRLYSDGSIKAVTSKGWQKFEEWPEFLAYCMRKK